MSQPSAEHTADQTTDPVPGLSRRGLLGTGGALALGATATATASGATLGALGDAAGTAAASAAGRPTGTPAPTGLLTSLLDDPLGIAAERPRLSWIVPALGRAPRQYAYQVQVAHTATELSRRGGVVWDSHRVVSADSTAVPYAGPPLRAGSVYHWRVRTWADPKRVSSWSAPQRVVTAAGDTWVAEPIWAPDGTVRLGDGSFEVSVTITSVAASLWFRAQDSANNYLWQLRAGSPGVLRTHVQRNGSYTVLADRPLTEPVPVGTPLRLRVELAGPTIRTYLGDVLLDTTVDGTYAAGSIGFRNGSTEAQRFHSASFTDPTGSVLVDEDFSAGPGVFGPTGTVDGGDLVVDRGQSVLATLGESSDWALLRTEVVLPARPIAAGYLYATGQSPEPARQYVYQLRVNDEIAGVGPVRAMAGEARYATHDVTDLLRPGRNALAALCYSARERSFLAQLVVVFADGTRQVFGTGPGWRARRAGAWRPPAGSTGGGYYQAPQEYLDARREPVGWTRAGFDDSGWQPAVGAPLTRPLAPAWVGNMEYRYLRPVAVHRLEPGRWLFDLGREVVGGVRLSVRGVDGQTVEVRLGEERTETGARYNLRAGQTYREVWTLRDGWQRLEHWGYRGFRWIELVADPGLDLSRAVEAAVLKLPWRDGDAAFASSDPDLDRVWAMCRYSIEATRQDLYQDTPTRERGPYEGDAIINQLSEYATQRSYALARYSTSYLARRPTWPAEYRLQTVLTAWQDYLATGDPSNLAADYDLFVDRQLDEALNASGLVEKNPGSSSQANADLVDWPASNRDGYVFTRVNTVINAWQYAAFDALSRIAGVLDRPADQQRYAELAGRLRAALNAELLDPVVGAYRDGVGTDHRAQHATAFPLALGVPQEQHVRALGEWLAGGGMRVSVYGAQFLLEALYRAGLADAAHRLLTSREQSSWLHMMDDLGATIVMEAWDPSIKPNTTFSHAWGSAPANIVPRFVAGVRPLAPGAREVLVAPQPGPLQWLRATVPTVRGPVQVRLDRRSGAHPHRGAGPQPHRGSGPHLSVTLPPNVAGRIELDLARFGVAEARRVRVRSDGRAPERAVAGGRLVLTRVEPGTTQLTWPDRH
ncbi:family 78 glycoside hydrolase catalytic domain [Plantactinospora sp. BB1]|uniref:family 78 glycoside hydrolase catalytic domain n=1 Tax=Plantactinospora sp. BB1 TaxID=2071627 RepID=UPI000D15DB3B|nr:family 78 glycoside hydrolase catalytic domain [Plantactinospora sp. BB1]AVT37927.1 hydrolase [Plantactinospora sp. BB1]